MRFEDALRIAGFRPREIVADGVRRRCSTDDKPHRKNGQYVLLPDGKTGFWRNFAEGMHWNAWHDGTAEVKPRDEAAIQAQREQEKAKRFAAIQASRELWESCSQYRVHPYIENKGLRSDGCHHLRLWKGALWVDRGDGEQSRWESVEDTWLAVPIYWKDRLVNVQRISSDGIKRQMKDAPQIGCHLILGRPRWAITVLAEGLATGLALYQCMPHARVVVVFYADNFLPVTQALKPTGSVVYAADNDWKTLAKRGFNPGIEKATNAARLIDAGVVYPKDIEGSDWADALREWGAPGIKRIQREVQAAARFVVGAPTA